jgi:arylsulfatase A-like enzyme
MTDDQTVEQYRLAMPFARRFFAERGTTFTTALAAPPLCCPSRAGFLTGQYPHNHGVFRNTPGYPTLREPESTLPVWLDRAGYRTAMVGKYLNGYEVVGGRTPAPGWDRWVAMLGYGPYFGFRLSVDGTEKQTSGEYSTNVLTGEAVRFVSRSARENESLFLWLAYNAPHVVREDSGPCRGQAAQPPSERSLERFARAPLPASPALDERDLSDKPGWLAAKAPLGSGLLDEMTRHWRCALAATRAVDRGFERLVGALESSGTLDNTMLVLVSDNGLAYGENRIVEEKRLPYESILRVPMAIAPPLGSGRDESGSATADEVVAGIDLAPTLLDYAGAGPCVGGGDCRTLDGRSLRPLLAGRQRVWPRDRGVLAELTDAFGYEAIRTSRYLYSEMTKADSRPLARPEIELYDLRRDPGELRNLWSEDRARADNLRARLEPRLERLRECSGADPPAEAAGHARACE